MFDFVHEKKRVVQVVLALIILPFAFWGVESYRSAGGKEPLATLNGETIGQQEFENEMNEQRNLFRERAGANFDPTLFDKPEIKSMVLERLVVRHVLASAARKVGLMPGDKQLAQTIASIDVFQKDGKFDNERYEAALKAAGKNRRGYEEELRQSIALQLMTEPYLQNGFASNVVLEKLIRLNEQQRVVAISSLTPESFFKQVKISDADVAAYYNSHADEFQLPESANVEYVVFSADSLLPMVKVSDNEVTQYYEDHATEFETQQEQRQAAHILIAVDKRATDAERQAAKAKAEDVLQQVKQSPEKFAALAKQYSQDSVSAVNGGDLGMFGRGAMTKPFEDSVFSLKVGEVSGLVQTEYGYHIIKLVSVKPAKIQPLIAVRGVIEQRLKSQLAADKFAEQADHFNNAVFEQQGTLKPAADLVNTTVQRGGWLSNGQAASGVWSDKALQAVFSEDVLKNKRNTAVIETGNNTLLAARVVDYKPASIRPLAEVAGAIRQSLQRQRAVEMSEQQGAEMLAGLQRGDKVGVSWKAPQTLSRNQGSVVPPELLQAVFRADTSRLPTYVGVANRQGGYLLARIDAVKGGGEISDEKRSGYADQLRQLTGRELLNAYLVDAKKQADISMQAFPAEEKK